MKVIVFCVNYNSYESMNRYLQSIDMACKNSEGEIQLTVVITDNSENKEKVSGNYSFTIEKYDCDENSGYFGGIEYGIKKHGSKLREYDYIIISNVDLEISEQFFSVLSLVKQEDKVACIAPSILSEKEKRDRNPKILSRPSKKKLQLQKLLYMYPILDKIYTIAFYSKRRNKVQNYPRGKIYAPHGSFMIFTRQFSDFIQTMDYPCFLFGEEVFIAENILKKELSVVYEPTLCVYDSDHVSTGMMKSKSYYKYNFLSVNMLLKEFFNE